MLPPDRPAEIDSFGFEPYVLGIENLLRETTNEDLPLTVGVYGPWGSGKSSFMKQLKRRLEGDGGGLPPLPCIWFDAWKYDRIADTRSALIYRILLDMKKEGDKAINETITGLVKKCAKVFGAFAFQSHVTIGPPGFQFSPPSVEEVENTLIDEAESFQTEVDEFSETFGEAVREFVKSKEQDKLVVFIDDLDRCLPENVISSLEALKLFLDDAPCVFVLGLDRSIVEIAIQNHYKIAPGDMGRDYLDKIVRVPFVIPPISPIRLRNYFESTVREFNEECWKIIEVASHGNPRLYTRFIGSWKVIRTLGAVGLDMTDTEVKKMLIIALAVLLRFPRLHELSMLFPSGFRTLYDRCQDTEWDTSVLNDDNQNAVMFYEFWKDVHTRAFFRDLRRELGRSGGTNPLEGAGVHIETAFRLTSSAR